jgi:hypothetical protein
MKRRTFLTSSVVAASTLLAGCSSVSKPLGGGDSGSLPSYHTSIAAESMSNSGTFSYLDVRALQELGFYDDDETATATPMSTATPPDEGSDSAAPLVAAPMVGSIFMTIFGLGFGLVSYGGVSQRLNNQFDTESVEADSDLAISSVLSTPDGFVIEGEFDTETYAMALPASFSEVDERDGFTVYENDAEEPAAIAIRSDTLIFNTGGSDSGLASQDAIGRILDARGGDTDRFADLSPDADWVLRTAGSHSFVIGSADDSELESRGEQTFNPVAGTPLADISTALLVSGSSITTSDGEPSGADADTALTHTDDPVEAGAVEDAYANSDADISVSTADGDSEGTQRVHISGSFAGDKLEL